jgi:LysR family transcriptional regulator, nod-box dependent transcriptional activator
MPKSEKNLRSFNLNSLPMLREILRHGSVTKAATALNVSQPALSAALRQLRHLFDDELIVRRSGGIVLTQKAESLLAPLESALQSIQALVNDPDDPSNRDINRIKIATSDYTMHLLSAPLVRALLGSNMSLGVQFLSVGGHSVAQLMSGGLDMIITPRAMMTTGLASAKGLREVNSEPLLTQHLLCIGRQDDVQLSAGLSIDEYLERPHVSLALDADLNISVERTFLAERSLKQNDVLLTSSYSSIPDIVAATGCLSLIPEGMAKAVTKLYPLQCVEPPISFPPLELVMVWHRRNDANVALIQLRKILQHCVGKIDDDVGA